AVAPPRQILLARDHAARQHRLQRMPRLVGVAARPGQRRAQPDHLRRAAIHCLLRPLVALAMLASCHVRLPCAHAVADVSVALSVRAVSGAMFVRARTAAMRAWDSCRAFATAMSSAVVRSAARAAARLAASGAPSSANASSIR